MNILIVGYGNIGKHIYEEFKSLQPYIKDPLQPQAERYPCNDHTAQETERGFFYDIAFICVPTDMLPDGSCDTSIVEQAVSEINADVIVVKSTVPPGTTKRLIWATNKKIIFSPEYYGVTQHCESDPGFVILGGEKELATKVSQAYNKVKNGYYKYYFTDSITAELAKYMLNSYLALKVTFCNEFADLANKFDISYPELRELFVADERVGNSHTYVYPDKPYYDSHCFNKDVPAIVQFSNGQAPLIAAMHGINCKRKSNSSTESKKIVYHSFHGILKFPEERYAIRLAKIKALREMQFKYECSICLIIRDESEYLDEWLNWHIGQGVEHFYIYDHGSKYPIKRFIQSLGQAIDEKVTVTNWSGSHENAQPDAYNDCLQRFGCESRWIGFIDTDEHVRVKTGQPLPEFLKNYDEFAGLMAIWIEYGACGQKHKLNTPLRQRFTQLSAHQSRLGKVFIQPSLMEDMYIHNGHTLEGFYVVGENKDILIEYEITKENPSTDLICVDHYYTKSYEEWLEKLRRGRCHAHYERKYSEFFLYNPDMEYCREDLDIVQQYEVSKKAG